MRRDPDTHGSTAWKRKVVRSREGMGVHPTRGRRRGVRPPFRHPGQRVSESQGRCGGGAGGRTSGPRASRPERRRGRRRITRGGVIESGDRGGRRYRRSTEELRTVTLAERRPDAARTDRGPAGAAVRRCPAGATDSRRTDQASAVGSIHLPFLTQTGIPSSARRVSDRRSAESRPVGFWSAGTLFCVATTNTDAPDTVSRASSDH